MHKWLRYEFFIHPVDCSRCAIVANHIRVIKRFL